MLNHGSEHVFALGSPSRRKALPYAKATCHMAQEEAQDAFEEEIRIWEDPTTSPRLQKELKGACIGWELFRKTCFLFGAERRRSGARYTNVGSTITVAPLS